MPFAAPGQAILWRNGRRVTVGAGASAGYDLTAYYAAMTVQPDAARKTLMQTFADSLLSTGIIGPGGVFRALYFTAAHDVQVTRINMLNPSEIATIAGGVTYTANRRLRGNATNGVVTTTIADNNAAPWSQNSASMFVYVNLFASLGAPTMGVSGALATRLTTGIAGQAPTARIHVNSAVAGLLADSAGLTVANRTGATMLEIWRNGILDNTGATTTTSAPTAGTFELFRNNAAYGDPGVAAWGFGGALTPTQQLAFYNALNTYLTAINPELFPDPNLTHVTDDTNGWLFSNGYPSFGATGGTGPGISASTAFDDDAGVLIGTDDTAFAAAIANGASYTVAITFASVTVSKDVFVTIGSGLPTAFTPANGIVTHTLVAGAGGGDSWRIAPDSDNPGGTYGITHISVKAA